MNEGRAYIRDTGIVYPDNPEDHALSRPFDEGRDLVLDENYPFYDRSFPFRWKRFWLHVGISTLVFTISPVRFALKIEGRSVLVRYRNELKNGAITVANHMHRWDFLMILQAIRWRRLYFPAWKQNLLGPDRNLIRLAGGIPVPDDLSGMKYFNKAIDDIIQEKKWLHVFPESANWPYYPYIRPFKKGMFSIAYKYNLPLLPMSFSYRPATGIYKVFKKNLPLITLRLGEPLFPDLSLPRKEAVNLLRRQCHEEICRLAGFEPGENPWQPEAD
jgi:1-acyl-sn-glycerol-3-phosphate acyltransferase